MLRDVGNEVALNLVKHLLHSFQESGTLEKLILSIYQENPKEFIHNATDISNFR